MDKRRHYLVNFATDVITRILQQRQLPFMLCGEMARAKHIGSNIPPSKVEIMIISRNVVLDDLKRSIVREQPAHFSFRATNMLRFRDTTLPRGGQRNIDVELTLSTATHSLDRIHTVDGFPLAPYSYILLRKLEDWDKLGGSLDADSINMAIRLSGDVIAMLKQFNVQRHVLPGEPFDSELRDASIERVVRFFAIYPKLQQHWRRLGFPQVTPLPVVINAPIISSPRASSSTARTQVSADTPQAPLMHQPAPIAPIVPLPETAAVATSSSLPKVAEKPRKRKPLVSRTQIRNMAAKATVSTLQELGIPCAIFGSMGCRMFGNPRPPNDVDMLLLPPAGNLSTQEDLKAAIVAHDPVHFFLKDAKDPEATYKVLHYRLDEASTVKQGSKVDILLPGVMHLPALPRERIVWQKRGEYVLPVVPFSVLLLQKIQGWDDHRTATEARYVKKAPVDVTDLANMLQMRHVQPLMVSRPWSDRALFSEEFEQLSRERVAQFCMKFPEHRKVWQLLGFETKPVRLVF